MQTIKRQSIAITEGELRELDALSDHFGEPISQVIRRSITLLYYITFNQSNKQQGCNENEDTDI